MDTEKVVGITAEYNPFHTGHAYQIEEIRRLLGPVPIIAVMSGSLTQRGEPALWDKWSRAFLALCGGVDLILELPVTCVLRSADHFAYGALSLMKETGIITHISFGMETPDFETLSKLADEKPDEELFRQTLTNGGSYASAIAASYKNARYRSFLQGSNNLLALSYVRAAKILFPQIQFLPIKRKGTTYNDTIMTGHFASAAAIRRTINQKGITKEVLNQLVLPAEEISRFFQKAGRGTIDWQKLDGLITGILETASPESLKCRIEVTEGLEDAIYKNRRAGSFASIAGACAGKRYSSSRLRRLLWQLILSGISLSFRGLSDDAPYIRILGFTRRGQELLKRMKKEARLPLLPIIEKDTRKRLNDEASIKLELDMRATNLREWLAQGTLSDLDFKKKPVMTKPQKTDV
jgi:predicted nucleotidyltransferase